MLRRAEASERAIGSKAFRYQLLLHLGRALLTGGMIEDATRTAREALAWASDHRVRPAIAGAHGLLGDIAKLRDPVDREEMELHVKESLTRAEALEMRPLATRCHLRLAWLYEPTGHRDHETHAAAAASLLARMGNPASLDAVGVH